LEFAIPLFCPAPELFCKEEIQAHFYIATCSFPPKEIGDNIGPKISAAIQGDSYVKNVLRSGFDFAEPVVIRREAFQRQYFPVSKLEED
jgi:hypothetical protein